MSIKISELPSASSVTSSDAIPIVQSGTTKKATVGTMLPTIATSITSSSTNSEVAGAKAVYDIKNQISAIKLYLGSDQTFTRTNSWQWQKVALNTVEFNYGSGLSYNATNNSIVIGANVSLVEITWTLTVAQGTPATTRRAVAKVTTDLSNLSNYTIQPAGSIIMESGQASSFSSSSIVSVSQGTEIALVCQLSDADTYKFINNRCCVTVKVLSEVAPTSTRSLNLTKGENTGSLVGMGDRAEVTLEKEEQPEEITETKSAEVDKLESEEGSGDSR